MFELGQLRSFVVLAAELHFGRAAARLNMTQPPLSRQIQALEESLDVRLFIRTSRSVRLTSSGQAFLREATRLLDQAETARLVAKRSSQADVGAITLGLIGASTYDVLPRFVREARRALPLIDLLFTEMLTPEQLEALARRRIDLGLGRLPSGVRGLQTAIVARERLLLAVPAGHPLEAARRLRLVDLGRLPLVGYEPAPSVSLHELLEQIFIRTQFSPNIVQRSKQTQTVLSLVSAGVGAALVPETARSACFNNVTFLNIDIAGTPLLEMHAIWREDNDNPALPAVISLIREHFSDGTSLSSTGE